MAIDIRKKVDTIAILMLENRSFDHMLGYLSLTSRDNSRTDIDGITSLRKSAYANTSARDTYRPFIISGDARLPADLPHARDLVDVQLKWPRNGAINMRGFVEAYRQHLKTGRVAGKAEPMGIHDAPLMMDFLAENYLVCNRWFAPLPTDTQPNRMMSLSGFTTVDNTKARVLDQPTVHEWLTQHQVRWRVYRSGLPFEMLMPRLWDDMLDPKRFRSFRRLTADVTDEDESTFPQVIFIEPSFGDSPVNSGFPPNDDHPPLSIGPGQHFMREAYSALTANPKRWEKTVLIVTYDEHGGFFDHVPPLEIRTDPPQGATYQPFLTSGIRVPALIVSPLVKARSVYDGDLDHTSLLQFIASRFGNPNEVYSTDVENRRQQGIDSVASAINRDGPRKVIPAPSKESMEVMASLPPAAKPPKTANAKAFAKAADQLLSERRADAIDQYPELALWDAARP